MLLHGHVQAILNDRRLHLIFDFFEGRGAGRIHGGHYGQHFLVAGQSDHGGYLAGLERGDGLFEIRIGADFRYWRAAADAVGTDHLHFELFGHLIRMLRIFLQSGLRLVGDLLHFTVDDGALPGREDRGFGLFEGLQMRILVGQILDDVVAVLGLDNAADLAWLQLESGLFELRDHLAALHPTQVAALGFGTGVFGVLGGQSGEVAAVLHLFQNVFGLGADFRVIGGRLALRHK